MTDASPHAIVRNLAVQRWGTPDATVGSVNEPREMEEHGIRFNEKWVYRRPRDDPRRPRERLLYWHRYAFVACFVVEGDGRLVREDPEAVLAGLSDRRYVPPVET